MDEEDMADRVLTPWLVLEQSRTQGTTTLAVTRGVSRIRQREAGLPRT